MSQIIKSYLGIFLLLLLIFTQAGVLKAGADMAQARHYYENCVAVMEASNLSETVIASMVKEGREKGYQLEVQRLWDYKNPIAKVELCYEVAIPFLKVRSEHTIAGIAR
ncbi:MAG: hypothetical protein RR364_03385 [Lachnospiraceae bacterium]